MNNNFELVLKNKLNTHVVYHGLIKKIVDQICNEIPKFNDLKNNPELTLLICNLIENVVKKSDDVDKKQLVCDVLTTIFNLTPEEIEATKIEIQFMYDHNKIRKVPWRKYIPNVIGAWIKKKFL